MLRALQKPYHFDHSLIHRLDKTQVAGPPLVLDAKGGSFSRCTAWDLVSYESVMNRKMRRACEQMLVLYRCRQLRA